MDFFIPTNISKIFAGDDRDTVDPLLGDAGLDESRIHQMTRRPSYLFCSDDDDGTPVIGYVAGINPIEFIEDPRPFDPGPESRSGLVVRGTAPASVDIAAFQLWIEK